MQNVGVHIVYFLNKFKRAVPKLKEMIHTSKSDVLVYDIPKTNQDF